MRRTLALATIAALSILLAACRAAAPRGPVGTGSSSARQVELTDADGWRIYGDYRTTPGAKSAVILLHQRNGTAADWDPLAERLTAAGIASLAIDQRGAGRSHGPSNGADAPWDTTPDIAAAVAWLGTQGFSEDKIALCGASYGANNALIFAARNPTVPAVALLSPGTNYHGLAIAPAARAYHGAVLVVYSSDDPIPEGGPSVIAQNAPSPPETLTLSGSAHGTDQLASKQAIDTVCSFLEKSLRKAAP